MQASHTGKQGAEGIAGRHEDEFHRYSFLSILPSLFQYSSVAHVVSHCSVETLRPELLEPLIRILRFISICHLTLELCNVIPRLIIQSILFIRSVSDVVWNGLHIVADFFVDNTGDVVDLSILETELITVVRVDLDEVRKVE
jgi:hypothetical protein